jgi:hypothetical protein
LGVKGPQILQSSGRRAWALATRQHDVVARWQSCGPDAALSHESAAALLEIRRDGGGDIEVSVPAHVSRQPRGVVVHRRTLRGPWEVTVQQGIPITAPCARSSTRHASGPGSTRGRGQRGRQARPDRPRVAARSALENLAGRPGVAILRELLDRRTFRLTDSQLEREFLLRVRRVGFPPPDTQQKVNGLRRLLLARSRSRGGDRWTALSPDAGAAGEGPSA